MITHLILFEKVFSGKTLGFFSLFVYTVIGSVQKAVPL